MIAWLRATLGLNGTDAAIRAAWCAAFRPNVDVLAVVDRLRAVMRVALLTDNPPLVRDGLDAAFPGLLARFDPAFFSYELGALKPSPAVFESVLRRLGLPAGAVCLIDDSAANVRGARDAAMHAILYRDIGSLTADLGRRLPGA
jgi:HAD superfamily hydrolase (TIGR01509 family)